MRRMKVNPRFYILAFAALAICLGLSFGVTQVKLRQGDARLAAKKAERDALVARIGELQREVDYAQTDEYVERLARDELQLIMPGEIRYVSN